MPLPLLPPQLLKINVVKIPPIYQPSPTLPVPLCGGQEVLYTTATTTLQKKTTSAHVQQQQLLRTKEPYLASSEAGQDAHCTAGG
jgi:hypothetical protein